MLSENESKYLDDFLNFITNTINMFCAMKFKSKIKYVDEEKTYVAELKTKALDLPEGVYEQKVQGFFESEIKKCSTFESINGTDILTSICPETFPSAEYSRGLKKAE